MTGPGRWLGPAALLTMVAALGLEAAGAIGPQGFDLLFAVSIGGTLAAVARRIGLAGDAVAGMAVAAALMVLALWPGARLSPWFAILAFNLGVIRVFLGGLLPGRRPVILQLVDRMHLGPAGTPAFEGFLRRQCWAWVAMALMTALAALVAMLVPAARGTCGAAVAGLAVLQAVWFVLSHDYARWRHKRPETWRATLRTLSDRRIWSELRL